MKIEISVEKEVAFNNYLEKEVESTVISVSKDGSEVGKYCTGHIHDVGEMIKSILIGNV